MARIARVAAAQLGRTDRTDDRQKTLKRMLSLLEQAATQNAELVLFPETARQLHTQPSGASTDLLTGFHHFLPSISDQ